MGELYIPLYEEERNIAPATVCVTGASGFVAGPIVQRLLAAGHVVHGTVRDPSNEKSVAALKALPGAGKGLKLFKGNLLEPGSFDEAVKGCKYVIHTASPFFTPEDQSEVVPKLLDPALKGTVNILETVNRCESIEKVVLTSSVAAIFTTGKGDNHMFTEEDWAVHTSETVAPYCYSKFLAEKKAWEIADAQSRWKLVCINPTYVMGPPIGDRQDGESIKIIASIFAGEENDKPDKTYTIVDVRDVAAAHCLAMSHPAAHGRNICCEGTYNVAQIAEFIHGVFPQVEGPAKPEKEPKCMTDNTKLQRELGFKFHSTKTCIQDMVKRLVEIGRIKA